MSPRAEPTGVGADLVALVHLCDLLCRMRGMGYGYYEPRKIDFLAEPAWAILQAHHPHMADLDLMTFTADLDHAADEVAKLVESVLAPKKLDAN